MSDDAMARILTMAILTTLVLWVPALEMCRNAARRLRRERAWRRFGADKQGIVEALERDLVIGRR